MAIYPNFNAAEDSFAQCTNAAHIFFKNSNFVLAKVAAQSTLKQQTPSTLFLHFSLFSRGFDESKDAQRAMSNYD